MAKQGKKTWIYVTVGVAVGVVAIFGASAVLNRDSDKVKPLTALDYQGCMLDDLSGKKDENDKTGISTKEFIEFEHLQGIEVGKNDVTYYVNAYNKDKKLIQVDEYTADLKDEDLTAYANLGVEYVKIEIVDPDDEEISFFDISRVSKLIEVELGEVEETEEEEDTNTEEEEA